MSDISNIIATSYRDISNNNTEIKKVLAKMGNNIIEVDTGLGAGPLNIGSIPFYSWTNTINYDSGLEIWLDYIFHTNLKGPNAVLDIRSSSSIWENKNMTKAPYSKFLKSWNNRMYAGYCRIYILQSGHNLIYKNKIFYTDLPNNREVNWGLESGYVFIGDGDVGDYNGDLIAANSISQNIDFVKNKIKIGDPIFLGPNDSNSTWDYTKYLTVKEILSPRLIKVNEKIPGSAREYIKDWGYIWVGSNWFDVPFSSDDEMMGFGENNNRLLIFGKNSLFRYDGSTLYQVKGVPGTTSNKSIQNIRNYTIYYHGSTKEKTGFYMYDGVTSTKISSAIQPFIDGIADGFEPVAWREGDIYRAYVGNISNINSTNPAYNISKTNAVFTYDVVQNRWFIDTINTVIKSSYTFFESGVEKTLIGNDSSQVLTAGYGNSFNGVDIPFKLETQPYYPRGSEVMNRFTRIKIVGRDVRGILVQYKLWDTPLKVDDEYTSLGELDNDTTELLIPTNHNKSCGIQLLFSEIGQSEPTYHIEKITIYSEKDVIVTPERKEQK